MSSAENATESIHSPRNNVPALEALWMTVHKIDFGERFVKALTMKDRGMLKHFIRFVAPHNAHSILDYVLHEWCYYRDNVEESAGLNFSPKNPSIPFLLKYCGEATNFWLKSQMPSPLSAAKTCKAPPKVTLEELLADVARADLEDYEEWQAKMAEKGLSAKCK